MKTKTNLLPHQLDAYNKLSKLKVGALYMEMGTGKTRTAIELIKKRLDQGKVKQVLWFCPCTVMKNLEKDIEKHAEGLLSATKIVGIESISMSDRVYLETLKYLQNGETFLVVDESNLVKNPLAMRTKRIYAISKLCTYKLILNGTPITRNEADLYSQWLILDPRIFGYRSYYSFARNHLELDEKGRIRRVLNVDYLTDKIAPYSFQISKDECLDLPRKVHANRWFDIDDDQNKHYHYVLNRLTNIYTEWDDIALFNLFTALQLVTSGRKIKVNDDGTFNHKPYFDSYKDNPRIETLDILLDQIWDKQIIIWAKYQFEIDEISELLKEKGISYSLLHGGLSKKQQERELEKFEKRETEILLGTISSGGYGLNLQYCSNMIYYSPTFNWGAKAQSEDRIHRIGQENECYYYEIYSDTGIDNMIYSNLAGKERLNEKLKNDLNSKNLRRLLSNDKDRTGDKTKRKDN